MTVLKKWKMVKVWYILLTRVVHLSVIIQIVLAAAGATFTMAHRVRARLGLGLGFVDIRVRVSVVYAKVYNVSWPLSCSAQRTSWHCYRVSTQCHVPNAGKCAVTYSARPRLTAKRVERVVSISWASCIERALNPYSIFVVFYQFLILFISASYYFGNHCFCLKMLF